jgi:type II secretory pathway pseudopilin PulG
MNFFPQPCQALSESPKLGAKQGHAKSTTFAKSATHTSKLHSHFRTLRSSARFTEAEQSRAAFSLTEVVIAMGVAAVAFTSIIALFPLGLNMSKESYESTQAALIAQTIMADLKDSLTTKDAADNYAKLIQKGGDTFTFDASNYATIALISNNSTTFFLAYDEAVRPNSSLQPILIRPYAFSTNLPPWYRDGAPKAFAIVKVTISKTFLLESGSDANPQKIDVWVETPGRFRETNRVQFLFTGVIPQQ